jgi:flagellar biosynthetic protein FlhB
MDYVALKIIDIAKEHGVTLTENKPLARALYEEVDLGREIPPTFYQEVAEILAWVYDLKNKKLPV